VRALDFRERGLHGAVHLALAGERLRALTQVEGVCELEADVDDVHRVAGHALGFFA
jgi:hypothetical protein